MLDFVSVATRTRNKVTEVYPKFIIKKSSDLMKHEKKRCK